MTVKDWNIEAVTGYKPLTSLYRDFSIADNYGRDAIMQTYKEALVLCKPNYKELTELVMVLNWKIWEHYETNEPLGRLYNDLWEEADTYALENLKGEELNYYLSTTD